MPDNMNKMYFLQEDEQCPYDINLLRHKSSCQKNKGASLLSSFFLPKHMQWGFCLKK